MSTRPLLLAVALALAAAVPHARATQGDDVESVRACMRRNAPAKSSVQEIVLTSVDRVGAERRLEAKAYWEKHEDRSRALIRIEGPADVRGSAALYLEREGGDPDLFVYLPELDKVRRITRHAVSGSLFGTDFTYEDFERLQRMARDVDPVRLPDATVQDRPVHVLAGRPAREGSQYERVVTFVDAETCVPLRVEMYAPGGALARVMEVDPGSIAPVDDRQLPRRLVVRDVEAGTHTEIAVEEIELDVDLPRKLFSQRELQMGH